MNKIWAPWRIEYIRQKKEKGCIFCRIFRQQKDKKNLVVLRSSHSFVVFNTYPYNNGHMMVVLNRHAASLADLTDAEILDMNKTLVKIKVILKEVLRPDAFNVGMNIGRCAGAGVDKHLHLHLVPRWQGDTNFMPVLSNTKIISQSLSDLYAQIEKCIQKKK